MMMLTNDFHATSTRVNENAPMTSRRVRDIRNRLCLGDRGCTCGDTLGARGRQADGYDKLVARAFLVRHCGHETA